MIPSRQKLIPYFMWSIPLFFFAFQFILRLWQGLMMDKLIPQFNIDASEFGMLAAFYYYGYAFLQIPIALLIDRYSPRYVLSFCAILCGVATFFFTITSNFPLALFSRFLVGAGSASALLCISKVIAQWFPKELYARMIGLAVMFGLSGAIYGGKPVGILIKEHSGYTVSLWLAGISIGIGIFTFLFLRSPKSTEGEAVHEPFGWRNVKQVFLSPVILSLGITNLLLVGTLEGFGDVWGVPYMMSSFQLIKEDAAGFVSLIFFGMMVGSPFIAMVTRRLGDFKTIELCGFGMGIGFIVLFFMKSYQPFLLSTIFFLIGILCGYQVSIFAASARLASPQNLGVTFAFLNCINMLGGSFFHTLIGKMVTHFSGEHLDMSKAGHYSSDIYIYSLSIIPAGAILGALIMLVLGIYLKRKKLL